MIAARLFLYREVSPRGNFYLRSNSFNWNTNAAAAAAAGAPASAAAATAAASAAASAARIYYVVIGGGFAPPYKYMIKYMQQKQQQ